MVQVHGHGFSQGFGHTKSQESGVHSILGLRTFGAEDLYHGF